MSFLSGGFCSRTKGSPGPTGALGGGGGLQAETDQTGGWSLVVLGPISNREVKTEEEEKVLACEDERWTDWWRGQRMDGWIMNP